MKNRALALLLCCVLLFATFSACGNSGSQREELMHNNYDIESEYQPRVNFGAKFEPKGNYILHGAGQDQSGITKTFDNYVNVMGSEEMPCISMGYTAPHHKYFDWAEYIKQGLEKYSGDRFVFLQIGVHFNKDENPDECYYDDIADGKMDTELKALINVLKNFDRPVYVRPGFEFNGEWNGYKDGEIYKRAFIRFHELAEECGAENFAFLWCYNPDAAEKDFIKYYPGDEYVDWWAIDIFAADSMLRQNTKSFLETAQLHNKPVMITEATPMTYDITKGEGWYEWFEVFFNFVKENPVIKGICYINWKWTDYPQWQNWGDARLEEATEEILSNYRRELSDPVYLHSQSKEKLLGMIYGVQK